MVIPSNVHIMICKRLFPNYPCIMTETKYATFINNNKSIFKGDAFRVKPAEIIIQLTLKEKSLS